MTGLIILVLAVAVFWLFIRRNEAADRLDRLDARLHMLEIELARLKQPESVRAERLARTRRRLRQRKTWRSR